MSWESKTQFFARLLALPAGRPCFRLRGVGLTVDLAIGRAELIDRKVAVGFSGCSLWKQLISFLRC